MKVQGLTDCDTFGMQRTEVCVFHQVYDEVFGSLRESTQNQP